ncbi:MAG: transcription antitermination factor NusB [Actinomycetota bacterium]
MSELGQQRHRARERALEILYEANMKDRPASVVLFELALEPDAYTVELLRAAESATAQAEDLITRFSDSWPLERIAVVDRLIMTLAIGELQMNGAPPRAVILDEAVQLAKDFSTDGSGSFVNGVLASIADELLEE